VALPGALEPLPQGLLTVTIETGRRHG
jgi:hypothetical protein